MTTRPLATVERHLMLPPEPGKDKGPSACGQSGGITVLFLKDVTCSVCVAVAEKVRRDSNAGRARADALNAAADETDDSFDHDELHAAADVVREGVSSNYIDRWVAGLEHRHNIVTEGLRP
jgi:hypothetical protein